jgi:hypothetical protein
MAGMDVVSKRKMKYMVTVFKKFLIFLHIIGASSLTRHLADIVIKVVYLPSSGLASFIL